MKRAVAATLAAVSVFMLGAAGGCLPEDVSGTVTDRKTESIKGRERYRLTIRDADGERQSGHVSEDAYERCQVGDRWPDCKK